jgi:RsiW-degrading membrane proteinase PrsW (M82 family)
VSAEQNEPFLGPAAGSRQPGSEQWGRWGQWDLPAEDKQAYPVETNPSSSASSANAQFAHREHVTGALPASPSDAPLFRPTYQSPYASPAQQQRVQPVQQGYVQGPGYPGYGYQGYPTYQGYPGYQLPYGPYNGYAYPGYNGYAPYWPPPRPRRDGFQLAVSIIALVCSILAILGGLACVIILLLFLIGVSAGVGGRAISADQSFAAVMTLSSFGCAGVVGGGFSLYHSIRSLQQRPSAILKLPRFWIFILFYILVLGSGFTLRANHEEVVVPPLTAFLIILAGIFPILAILSLGVRRLRFPAWTTSWRRFTLAITSGATLGIGLALILELGFLILLLRIPDAINALKAINDPQAQPPAGLTTFSYIFLIVAVMGPIVEETVKPLGVAFFIGRIRSASEAFALGMSAGLGFALIETIEYISSGYHDWLFVALERTAAGLLHGVGAGMVALGWYYLLHGRDRRFLKAFACWAYAVFQHLVWNGTAVLSYLPNPYGTTINSWNVNLGFTSLPFVEIPSIVEAILILVFLLYITRQLRTKKPDEKNHPSPSTRVPVGV